MSISTAAMTAICLGTSTYAWFSRNDNVWIEETDLYVNSYDGLLISLDGTNFSQDISSDDLKKAITKIDNVEEARNAYSSLNLIGTTMKQDSNGEVSRDLENSIMFTHDVVNHIDNEYINNLTLINQATNEVVCKLMIQTGKVLDDSNKIINIKAFDNDGNELEITDLSEVRKHYDLETDYSVYEFDVKNNNELVAAISNLEIISYVRETFTAKDLSNDSLKYLINYVDNGYSHNDYESEKNENYLQFDLYFRIASDNGAAGNHGEFDLRFTDNTFLKSKEKASVILNNKLTAGEKKFDAGDEINFDVANAMRVAVDTDDKLNIFEVTTNDDLGSVAIEGSQDPKYDKTKNAMFTYYNNLFPNYPFVEAAKAGKRFETNSTFTNVNLGKFTYDNDLKQYNDIHATVYVWLEGWDADYFLGTKTESRNMSLKLEFKYKDELNG